ncbi:MAG: GNAT family N-acetyltransferase, partial [Mycobacteriales bacterium]
CRALVAHPIGEPGGLVSYGAAWIHQIMPALWLPSGKMGYLQGFYTVPAWRGRGISRGIAEQLLAWLTEAGCTQAHLHAVAAAAPLYQRLGFVPARNSNLWLKLSRDRTD